MIIYKVTNKIDGKVYIGQTRRSLNQRMSEHLSSGRTSYFDRALNKYGLQSFIVEIIDKAETKEELNEKEQYYIRFFNCKVPNGYNLTDGGEGQVGVRRFGSDNPHWNKKHSEETKKKLSKIRKKYIKENHPRCKPIINLDTNEVFSYMNLACDKYNLDPPTLTKVCKGKRKTCGGYRWSYYEK